MPWLVSLVGSLIIRVVSLSAIALTIIGVTLGPVGVPMVEIELLIIALIATTVLLVRSHIF